MKTISRVFCALGLGIVAVTVYAQTAPSNTLIPSGQKPAATTDSELLKKITERASLTQITTKPETMNVFTAMRCASIPPDHALLTSSQNATFRVYITPNGVDAFKASKPSFPIGTVILKEKFPGPNSTTPELFTGMLKREKGFNPACGDWEFFTVNGLGNAITARGRIDSCMECHKAYPDTDFVTHDYLTVFNAPAKGGSKPQ